MDNFQVSKLVEGMLDSFQSWEVGEKGEVSNIVDTTNKIAEALDGIGRSLGDPDVLPFETPDGGSVRSITEGLIYLANNAGRIADGLNNIADAIRETKGNP